MRFLLVLVVWQSMWGPCFCLLNVNKLHGSNVLLSAVKTFKVIAQRKTNLYQLVELFLHKIKYFLTLQLSKVLVDYYNYNNISCEIITIENWVLVESWTIKIHQDSQFNSLESSCRWGLSADMLQMPGSGIWGNPSGFVEEAMQVQSILAPCRHHEKGSCTFFFSLEATQSLS